MKKQYKHKRVKFEKGIDYYIPKGDEVKVTEFTGGRTKITHINNSATNLTGYTRCSNNTYFDPTTGTYKKYKKTDMKTRSNMIRSIKNTVEPLLINNFFGGKNEVFITLTFEDTMSDFYCITKYYDKFWRKLCRKYKQLELACVYVKELQYFRNCWHIHAIVKEVNNKYLFIPFDVLAELWGLGGVWINRVIPEKYYKATEEINIEKQMNNLAFSEAPDLGIESLIDYMCKLKSKLGFIPTGSKIHGSKGKIIKPKISRKLYSEVEEARLKDSICIDENTLLVKDIKTNNILKCIHNEYWVSNKKETDNE